MPNSFNRSELIGAYEATTGHHLKEKSGELHGPCPSCGGEPPKSDRFWITKDGHFGCRNCKPGSGKGDTSPEAFKAILTRLGLADEDVEPRTYAPSPKPADVVSIATGQKFDALEPAPQVYGCTLEQYAERTQLPLHFLRDGEPKLTQGKCWVSKGLGEVDAVFFPYALGGGKWRVAVKGGDKYRYQKGSKASLYGIEQLQAEKVALNRSIVVVEGESDTQTCWFHGIAAVGVPGTSAVDKAIIPGLFDQIREVYVVQEPDEAGSKFPAAIQDKLVELNLDAVVIPIVLPTKDVNKLHRRSLDAFHREWQKAAKDARRKTGRLNWRPTSETLNRDLTAIPWLCYPILRPGLAVLWAPAFAGKSTFVLQLCHAMATGKPVSGLLEPARAVGVRFVGYEQGDADDKRRMWAQIGAHPGDHDYADFMELDSLPRANEGGVEALSRMLTECPDVKMLVIDTLARFWDMGVKKTSANAFYVESEALGRIEKLATAHGACVVLIHHSTASKAKVSGTEAIRAIPRCLIHLDRPDPDSNMGTIAVTHNGAPGVKLGVRLVPGQGWLVEDPDFERKYRESQDRERSF